ncbi:hypothetical protein GQ53DRAFT_821803 [Thozetella sp. PMI_491]|nr:hypothetical protein GQ53DRAFT_821803 [Thozetella sp. PMI_491]
MKIRMEIPGVDTTKIPALPPPPGVTSNFVDPPSQAHIPKIVIYVTAPLMVLVLGIRLHTRFKTRKLGWDDYLCIMSFAAVVADMVLSYIVVEQAAGPHMWDIPLSKITVSYAQNVTTAALTYYVAAMFIKASILALYIRVFSPLRAANIMLWAGIIFSTVFHLATIITYLATCLPKPEDEATGGWLSLSFDIRTYRIVGYLSAISGTIGTVIDFYILFVPLAFLWSLRISFHRTMALSGLFATGAVAVVFSTLCTVYRWSIANTDGVVQDLSWKGPPIYAYGIAEINIGIICSCMPIIFGTLKGFATTTGSWITKLRYSRTSKGTGDSEPSQGSEANISKEKVIEDDRLPPVPHGEIRGLKSFMRNFNRTKPAITQTQMSEAPTLRSVDYSYHEHLKQGARAEEGSVQGGSDHRGESRG